MHIRIYQHLDATGQPCGGHEFRAPTLQALISLIPPEPANRRRVARADQVVTPAPRRPEELLS